MSVNLYERYQNVKREINPRDSWMARARGRFRGCFVLELRYWESVLLGEDMGW